MPSLADVTPEQIGEEIARVGYALTTRAWKLNEELGAFGVVHQDPAKAPLGEMIRDVFAHARGERTVPEVYEQCQDLVSMLWCPPTEGHYRVPPEFYRDTLLGQAIRSCIGDREVALTEAARIAGVSRSTIHRAADAGELPISRMVRSRRVFREGDVRAWVRGERARTD